MKKSFNGEKKSWQKLKPQKIARRGKTFIFSRIIPPYKLTIRIMERAYQLRDTREKARQEYVQKRLDDQWRDSCDDARTLDSKAMVKFLNQERLRQIQEKIERKQQLSSQEDSFLVEWNRQLDELAKRDTEKAEYRRRIDRETSEAVRNQVREKITPRSHLYLIYDSFFRTLD